MSDTAEYVRRLVRRGNVWRSNQRPDLPWSWACGESGCEEEGHASTLGYAEGALTHHVLDDHYFRGHDQAPTGREAEQ